jgi:Na+-driven multidrug efflux pump
MVIGTFVNIALNLALVLPFELAGVAVAGLLAQTAASFYCLRAINKIGIMKGERLKWDGLSARKLLRLGLPLGFRNAVIESGGLVVQRYVNEYGANFVAGIAAAKRMYSLLLVAGGAIEASVATFTAQNFGQKNITRVKQGVKTGLILMMASAAVIMAVTLLFGREILALLIDGEQEQLASVLDYGVRQLNMLTYGLPILSLLFLYRSALVGMGNSLIPMISGFLEMFMRIAAVVFITPFWGEWAVYLSDIMGWTAAAGLLVISYFTLCRKRSLT